MHANNAVILFTAHMSAGVMQELNKNRFGVQIKASKYCYIIIGHILQYDLFGFIVILVGG